MPFLSVRCPHCLSEQLVKRGKTPTGTQRYLCPNPACAKGSFLLDYPNRGGVPEVKQPRIALRLNARGIRDRARVLRSSPDTGLRERTQNDAALESVNTAVRRPLKPAEIALAIERTGEAEREERGRFVGKKGPHRWRWQALAHHTGAVWA